MQKTMKVWPIYSGKKAINRNCEEAQMLDLIDKDCKLALLGIFKKLKESMSTELKESMTNTSYQIENVIKGHKF